MRTMLKGVRKLLRRTMRATGASGRPAVEQGPGFYDERYRSVRHKRLPYHRQAYYGMWTIIADRVRNCRGVLEVGSGAGHLAALMLDQGLARYQGFDFSRAAVELARTHRPDADFSVADAFETDLFESGKFDTIVCTEVLEHIDRDRELIMRWPSGCRCLFSVPDFPGTAHVRHFTSAEDAYSRYVDLFSSLNVTTVLRASERPARFFLLDGIRK